MTYYQEKIFFEKIQSMKDKLFGNPKKQTDITITLPFTPSCPLESFIKQLNHNFINTKGN